MADTVADFMLERLREWGIRRFYGYPGDGINGLLGAMGRASADVDFVQVRHEELAAFMACAHAKYTGEVGCCVATSGPGAIHLLNGLYDAKLDHQPVVAIVGQAASTVMGGHYQQEVDLHTLFRDVAGEYVHTLMNPVQTRHIVDRAVRIALAERTVTCIILPNDVQEMRAVKKPPHAHNTIHSSVGYMRPYVIPEERDLHRAAEILNHGQRVAMLVGAGCLSATDEVIAVAERLGAGVAKALLGKAAVPDDLPFVTGSMGLLGTKPSFDMMEECDTLLMVGSSFPYSEFLPREGRARGIQIDIDGRMLGIRYPMELNLIGDSASTLRALLPLLRPKTDRSWRNRIEKNVAEWWKVLEARALNDGNPVNPQRLFWELSQRLSANAILACDSGSAANWYARDIKIKRGMKASLSGTLATMGPAVPYALAAKIAYPDRPVIAMTGDGAMQMNGMNDIITIARHWREWSDPHLIILVLNNRDLNQVTWEMRVLAGNPKYEASQSVPDFPYAAYAQMLGLRGIVVDRPSAAGPAWDEALAADRPVIIDAHTDPNIPPLPPHITFKQAKNFTSALVKGDVDALGIVRASLAEEWEELVPHGH
ncbi:thiamine pyrophosphate-requiring protein [Acidiferrobacter sp. SPIII_3]|jgi:pyruvate dehydrogenase (quinone)|uniref:thiamine pyrophosphate-requiring protein n=1 Tax=Acidiferrobacter sp. SPIII_3 TaxID=1281578 RepID=UPI000D730FB6|nr:thiamine pyrophosphate-requiring protein [Acidiferrobacter sp. SPIII_3]AWP23411.1 thiamine pyrophosphate-requiring protein [Acidiferrobacter sp. SPIII_3]